MGVVSNVVVQAVISFVVLGSLKRAGVIRVESRAIENPAARGVFEKGMEFGESIASAGERVLNEFRQK